LKTQSSTLKSETYFSAFDQLLWKWIPYVFLNLPPNSPSSAVFLLETENHNSTGAASCIQSDSQCEHPSLLQESTMEVVGLLLWQV
jgi:hypothetical protein